METCVCKNDLQENPSGESIPRLINAGPRLHSHRSIVWITCVYVWVCSAQGVDWQSAETAPETKGCHGNSQGWRRRAWLWCCAWRGEMDTADRMAGSERWAPWSRAHHASAFSPRLPPCSLAVVEWVGGCKENKRCISMRQLSGNWLCCSVSVLLFPLLKLQTSALSAYCTIYQHV